MTQNEANQLNESQAKVRGLWNKMCDFDGLPHETRVAIFSKDNPYTKAHFDAMTEFFALSKRVARNGARREKYAAYKSLGLNQVRGALGGVYYE